MEFEGVKDSEIGLKQLFGDAAEIVAIVVCGDFSFGENNDDVTATVLEMIKKYEPGAVITGPAFKAGRANCFRYVFQEFCSDIFKKFTYMAETRNSAVDMKCVLDRIVPLASQLARSEAIGTCY